MNVRYLVSRAAISAVLGVALGFAGLRWWWAALAGAAALGLFFTAPRSGRYVVRAQGGVAPLRRDERARAIRDRAARNGFVLTVLGVAGLTLVYGLILDTAVPVAALGGILALAFATYFASDLWLRRLS
jgi:hypothetical protein